MTSRPVSRSRHIWFVLDDQLRLVPSSELEVSIWAKGRDLRIAQDRVNGAVVSTSFTCLDVTDGIADKPLLWETRIFGGPQEFRGRITHSATYEQAVEAHRETLAYVRRRMGR